MQMVGDHQLDAVAVGGVNHPATVAGSDGHELFAEDMNAGPGRLHGVFAMEAIGKCDIDGVDHSAAQALLMIFIGVDLRDAILPAESAAFHGIVGFERGKTSRGFRVDKGRKDGDLRNMPESDNGESEGAVFMKPNSVLSSTEWTWLASWEAMACLQ